MAHDLARVRRYGDWHGADGTGAADGPWGQPDCLRWAGRGISADWRGADGQWDLFALFAVAFGALFAQSSSAAGVQSYIGHLLYPHDFRPAAFALRAGIRDYTGELPSSPDRTVAVSRSRIGSAEGPAGT